MNFFKEKLQKFLIKDLSSTEKWSVGWYLDNRSLEDYAEILREMRTRHEY